MRKAKWIMLLLATLGIFHTAKAQKKKAEERSLLWEVSGKGLKQPSYIFGTIHMICADDYVLKPKVERAFAAAKNLILEIDLSDTQQIMGMMTMMMNEKPMSESLNDTEEHKLDSILKHKLGMPLSLVDHISPGAVYLLLAQSSVEGGCDSMRSYEVELMNLAKAAQKPMLGLESVREQMDMLNTVFDAKALLKALEDQNESGEMDELVQAYKQENLSQLYHLINESELKDPSVAKVLLIDRNKNWAEKMPPLMEEGTQLFAVGAGHLGGADGVLELLRKKGYSVQPIFK